MLRITGAGKEKMTKYTEIPIKDMKVQTKDAESVGVEPIISCTDETVSSPEAIVKAVLIFIKTLNPINPEKKKQNSVSKKNIILPPGWERQPYAYFYFCRVCGKPTNPAKGDIVLRSPSKRYYHIQCAPEAPEYKKAIQTKQRLNNEESTKQS